MFFFFELIALNERRTEQPILAYGNSFWQAGKYRVTLTPPKAHPSNRIDCTESLVSFSVSVILLSQSGGGGGGGGSGFFLACEDLGRMFDHSTPACAFFSFFLKWKLARSH